MAVYWALEGVENPPRGVRGGGSPRVGSAYLVDPRGSVEEHPAAVGGIELQPGERVGSRSPGGGAAAHGREAAVRAASAQRPAKPKGLLADAPWAVHPSVRLIRAVQHA